MNRVVMLAFASILVGIVVLALKSLAYLMTGSVALLSDAIESIVNVATAVAAFIAIRLSAKPADAEHPYGHHKAEYFSAVLEGVLIVIAAIAILREAYFAFLSPRQLDAPWLGLAVNAAALAIRIAGSSEKRFRLCRGFMSELGQSRRSDRASITSGLRR